MSNRASLARSYAILDKVAGVGKVRQREASAQGRAGQGSGDALARDAPLLHDGLDRARLDDALGDLAGAAGRVEGRQALVVDARLKHARQGRRVDLAGAAAGGTVGRASERAARRRRRASVTSKARVVQGSEGARSPSRRAAAVLLLLRGAVLLLLGRRAVLRLLAVRALLLVLAIHGSGSGARAGARVEARGRAAAVLLLGRLAVRALLLLGLAVAALLRGLVVVVAWRRAVLRLAVGAVRVAGRALLAVGRRRTKGDEGLELGLAV